MIKQKRTWRGVGLKMIGFLFVGAQFAHANFSLSGEGKTPYVIAKSNSSIPSEMVASEELSKYLSSVTGAEFKVMSEGDVPEGSKAIYVGQTRFAADHGVDFDKMGQEEWVIKTTSGGDLILSGGRPRGTLYSVYEFLEKYVGCHWLDETNEVVPSISSLTIPVLDVQAKPDFRIRWFFDKLDWYPVSGLFKQRNKGFSFTQPDTGIANQIGRPGPHHTFFQYSKDWSHDEPELFSLNKEGQRVFATSGEGPGQICMTNADARKRVLSQLKDFIAADREEARLGGYPAPTVYDISINDNAEKCLCENCKKLGEKEGDSGVLLDFINEIATGVKKDYPDIYVRTFAYMFTAEPPKNIRAVDNVIIHLAILGVEFGGAYNPRDTMRALERPENDYTRKMIEAWGKKADNIAMWDYWILYPRDPEPFVKVDSIEPNMAFYKRENVKYMFIECENPNFTSFFALTRYLGYKFMQNPDQKAKPWIDGFMQGYYGPAAQTMQELLTYMGKRQEEHPGPIGNVDIITRSYLDMDYFQTTLGLLDKAEKLVEGDQKRLENVQRERIPILAGLFMRWGSLDGVDKKFDGKILLDQFRKLAERSIDYYFAEPDTVKFRPEILGTMESAISRFETNLRKPALPTLPKGDVVDIPMSYFITTGKAVLVDDPEAARGKAISLKVADFGEDPLNQLKNKETSFSIQNWMEGESLLQTQIPNYKISDDEKYHLIKIGDVTFTNNSRAQLCIGSATWGIKCELYRMFAPGSTYSVYVSVRLQGPEYVPKSTKESGIMVDRVLFVRDGPAKGKTADR